MTDLIKDKTNSGLQDLLNEVLMSKAILICPILNKFSIDMVNYWDSNSVEEVNLRKNDAFSYFLKKEGFDPSTTYAEIIVNKDLWSSLCLTNKEIMAGIAHEIGHIILFFRSDKEDIKGQAEEVCCDDYACRMGLASHLLTLLEKLIKSGLYSEMQIQIMKNRHKL